MNGLRLISAVDGFAQAGLGVRESDMTRELAVGFADDDPAWGGYETVREAYYRVYQELRGLSVVVAHARRSQGIDITSAQRILAQHHLAYRDLWGALAGVGDHELDIAPAENEWPLRVVLAHMFAAERGFQRLVSHALARLTAPDLPEQLPREDLDDDAYMEPVQGSLAAIRERFDALHASALDGFALLSEAELRAPSWFWEGYPLPISFRLHRFDAHLREHTIQVDKTLLGIGHPASEAERLVRLIYNALGEAEGVSIGASDIGDAERERVIAIIERVSGYVAGVR